MIGQFVVFKDVTSEGETEYRFRLVANNEEPIAQSEGYGAKQSCQKLHAKYFPHFEWVDKTGEV